MMTASAVVLSVCIGVGGWRCPISSNVMRMGIASLALIYNAPISASAADVITDLMICAMFKTAPLFGGNCVLFDMDIHLGNARATQNVSALISP